MMPTIIGAGDLDILDRQIKLEFVVFGIAAVFGSQVGEDATELHLVRVEEGHHAVIERIGRGDRCLSTYSLANATLASLSMKVCWQLRPTPFMVPT